MTQPTATSFDDTPLSTTPDRIFSECASLVLAPDEVAVFEAVDSLEEMADVAELVELLTRTPVASR